MVQREWGRSEVAKHWKGGGVGLGRRLMGIEGLCVVVCVVVRCCCAVFVCSVVVCVVVCVVVRCCGAVLLCSVVAQCCCAGWSTGCRRHAGLRGLRCYGRGGRETRRRRERRDGEEH